MRVFLTGATGFIGMAIIRELIAAGHEVLGLARSDVGAQSLIDAGAQVHRGELENLKSLEEGAATSDGVIHCAFNHDFAHYAANCEADRHAIEALGSALVGSDRPFIVTSGTAVVVTPGRPATEADAPLAGTGGIPRSASEEGAAAVASRGVRTSVIRLPQIHNHFKQGLISAAIAIAREKGVSAYVDEGRNRWPAAHLLDTAHLYRLALEKGSPWAVYHAVAEEGVPAREIAQVIGQRLNLPIVSKSAEEAAEHFGWFGFFAGLDCPASSKQTRQLLGWHPMQPGLIADLLQAHDLEI